MRKISYRHLRSVKACIGGLISFKNAHGLEDEVSLEDFLKGPVKEWHYIKWALFESRDPLLEPKYKRALMINCYEKCSEMYPQRYKNVAKLKRSKFLPTDIDYMTIAEEVATDKKEEQKRQREILTGFVVNGIPDEYLYMESK
jgi:hypothetical protein